MAKGKGGKQFFRKKKKKNNHGDDRPTSYYFTFAPEKWDKEKNERVDVELSRGRRGSKVKFTDKLFKYDGTQTLEMFLQWWIELDKIIFHRDNLSFKDKLQVIDRSTGGAAQDTVSQVFNDMMSINPGGDYLNFHWENHLIKYHLKQLRDIDPSQKRRGEDELRVQCWYEGYECEEKNFEQQQFAVRTTVKKWVQNLVADEQATKEYNGFVLDKIRY